MIAYIMKTRKMGFKEAISLVRAKRKNICPNLGFERQLKQYEKDILYPAQAKVNLKKTVSEKISEERRTSYNHFAFKNIQDHFKD